MVDILNDDVLSPEMEKVHLEKEIKEKNEFLKTQQVLMASEIGKIGDEMKKTLSEKENEGKIKKFFKRLLNTCK
jgi:hypothetical protein